MKRRTMKVVENRRRGSTRVAGATIERIAQRYGPEGEELGSEPSIFLDQLFCVL
jgi:hypothetical protein